MLAGQPFAWEFGQSYDLQIIARGNQILASVDGVLLFEVEDLDRPFSGGGIALVCEEGRVGTDEVCVRPFSDGK